MVDDKNSKTGEDDVDSGATPSDQATEENLFAETEHPEDAELPPVNESDDFADADQSDDATPETLSDSDGVTAEDTGAWDETDDPIELNVDPNAPVEPDAATDDDELSATDLDDDVANSPADEPENPEHPEAVPEHEVYEEEAGPSFASRALLVLILLLAGAAVGIWAAPKIATSLPAGMAPVAKWMMPGATLSQENLDQLSSEISAKIAGLEDEVKTLQSELAAVPNQEALDARIGDHVTAAIIESEARTADALNSAIADADTKIASAVKNAVDDIAAPETRQHLAQLQNGLEGQIAQLNDLKTQLQGGLATTTENTAETAANIDVYRSELEGLRAELGNLTSSVTGLGDRIDTVASTADRSIASAQADVDKAKAAFAAALDDAQSVVEETRETAKTALTAAAIEADVAQIGAALATSQPYIDPVARLQAGDVAIPEGLAASAETGVPTILMLRDSFSDAAHSAIRAGIVSGAGDGVLSRAKAYLEAQVSNRSLAPKEGLDPDAVLSRMEDALRREDLTSALQEAEQLPSEAAAAMQPWLDRARARASADAGLVELEAGLPATN